MQDFINISTSSSFLMISFIIPMYMISTYWSYQNIFSSFSFFKTRRISYFPLKCWQKKWISLREIGKLRDLIKLKMIFRAEPRVSLKQNSISVAFGTRWLGKYLVWAKVVIHYVQSLRFYSSIPVNFLNSDRFHMSITKLTVILKTDCGLWFLNILVTSVYNVKRLNHGIFFRV